MLAHDVLLVHLGIELLGLAVEAWEPLLVVRDEETTIGSTLQSAQKNGREGG